MFNAILSLLRIKKVKDENFCDITGFMPAFDNIESFKRQHNLSNCKAKTMRELVQYLDRYHEEKWYVMKPPRGERNFLINCGVFDSFPGFDDLYGTYGGGKYVIKALSLGKHTVGFYKFEGKDKSPMGIMRYKPKNLKEAFLLSKIEEGDKKLLNKIAGLDAKRDRRKPLLETPLRYSRNL